MTHSLFVYLKVDVGPFLDLFDDTYSQREAGDAYIRLIDVRTQNEVIGFKPWGCACECVRVRERGVGETYLLR